MSKFSKECIDAAIDKLKDFSQEEIEAYMSEVFSKSREYSDLGSQASISKAIEEINNEKLQALFEETTITANNAKKFQRMTSMIKDKKATVNELAIRARTDKNKDFNIESSQRAAMNKLHKVYHDPLSPEELNYVTNPENDIQIGRAIDGKDSTPEAMKIAESHYKLVDTSSSDLVTSNAMPIYNINKRRQIHATHDRRKIINPGKNPFKIINSKNKYNTEESRNLWMSEIKQHLDLKETYKKIGAIGKDGTLDMEKIDKHLSRTFDNITNGHSEIFTKSSVMNDLNAIKQRQRMFFVWKDTESWLRYNKKYGTGDYYSAVDAHIRASANKIGAAEMFGDNPRSMFMNLMDKQKEVTPDLSRFKVRTIETNFKHITGIDHAAVDPNLAAFGSNIRTLTGMARLGNIGVLSMGDVTKGASHLSKFGFGFWSPLMNNIKNIFNNPAFNNDERKYIAKVFKLNVDSHLGYMGKFVDATTIGDATSKFTNAFYRANLMHGLDKGNKISVMHMMAKGLGDNSSKSHSLLHDSLKKQLSKYGITPKEWDVLRKKNTDNLFTTDNVDSLTNEEIESFREPGDKSSLAELKNKLYRKVYTLFDVASTNAIGAPDTYMKAFLLGDTRSGTKAGELLRALMQFKAFPLQHIDRMYINNLKDTDGVSAKSAYLMNMFIASFGLNLLSKFLDYRMMGKSMPDINRMSAPEKAKFVMESMDSNIGLLYKGFSNSYPGKFKAMYLMSSPSTDFVGNIIDAMYNSGMGLTGDKKSWKRAATSAKKAAQGITPTGTIPILSPYMNQVMGDKSYLQPGQKQLFGK